MSDSYMHGFVERCRRRGVNPERLLKVAEKMDKAAEEYRKYLKNPRTQRKLRELERKGYRGGAIGLDPDEAEPGYLR